MKHITWLKKYFWHKIKHFPRNLFECFIWSLMTNRKYFWHIFLYQKDTSEIPKYCAKENFEISKILHSFRGICSQCSFLTFKIDPLKVAQSLRHRATNIRIMTWIQGFFLFKKPPAVVMMAQFITTNIDHFRHLIKNSDKRKLFFFKVANISWILNPPYISLLLKLQNGY